MKNLIISVLIGVAVFFCAPLRAQKNFSGIIEYSITYPELSSEEASLYPQKAILTVKDKMSMYEIEYKEPNYKYTQIANSENKSLVFLYENFYENNYHVIISPEEVNEAISTFPKLEVKKATTKEKVANIKVKKVSLSLTEYEETITEDLYYHPKANGESFTFFRYFNDIKYLPLKFTLYDNGQKAVYEAVKVSSQKINKEFFIIDKKFLPITFEELEDIYYQNQYDYNYNDYEEPVEEIDDEYMWKENNETHKELYIINPETDSNDTGQDEIFAVVEEMPSYQGGNEAMINFLIENLKYPNNGTDVHGTVYVNFVVEGDGSITNIKVLRGIGGGADEEAIRVVQLMPKWIPGKHRGKPVRVSFNLPIKFHLK